MAWGLALRLLSQRPRHGTGAWRPVHGSICVLFATLLWRRSRLVRELFSIVFSPVALCELASAQTASALAFHGHLAQRCRWADNFLSDSDGQLDDED